MWVTSEYEGKGLLHSKIYNLAIDVFQFKAAIQCNTLLCICHVFSTNFKVEVSCMFAS